jgi:hypothetical protein
MVDTNWPKKFKLNELFTSRILNNARKFLKDNTIKWFALCLANEECKNMSGQKLMSSEICIILSHGKKFQIISVMKIKYENSNLTYYS